MLLRSHFTVDLWFIFGSFCYGAEASIVSCNKSSLNLRIKSSSAAAQDELLAFFEHISDKSKALVRTEVRIFVNSNPEADTNDDWAEELLTTLMTDAKPNIGSQDEFLDLELTDVCGLTSSNQDSWDNLVTEIWPQLPS